MNWPWKKKVEECVSLDEAIANRATDLWATRDVTNYTDEELAKLREIAELDRLEIENLTSLIETDNKSKKQHWWSKVDPNTVLIILGNAIISIVVIKHEEMNVITSKAKQFWLNLKR